MSRDASRFNLPLTVALPVTSFQATVHWFKSWASTCISQCILNLGAHRCHMYLTYALLEDNCVCHRLLECVEISQVRRKLLTLVKLQTLKREVLRRTEIRGLKSVTTIFQTMIFFKFDFSISNTDRIIGYLFPLCILKTVWLLL